MKDDNARLRAAIDKLRVPIYIKDPQGRYLYANELACELLERARGTSWGAPTRNSSRPSSRVRCRRTTSARSLDASR